MGTWAYIHDMYRIYNEVLSVGVNEKGAELASLQSRKDMTEYLWQADSAHWGRHSCILFPVVGCVKNGHTMIKDDRFPMTKHGLVRNRQWHLLDHNSDQMTFTLLSNEDSLSHYPYEFELRATYTLSGLKCTIRYEVETKGSGLMPFNIGAHPAFNCPLGEGLSRSDYKIVFHESEYQDAPIINQAGLISSQTQLVLDNQTDIRLTDDLFDQDALILEGLNSQQLSLIDKGGKKQWTFDFGNCSHLGIWSANRQSPFVCIEPWFGVADYEDASGVFVDKPSIQWVRPDEVWSYEHSITIRE